MKCPMCDNELKGRQKYCSPNCRKRASRNVEPQKTRSEEVTERLSNVQAVESLREPEAEVPLTAADATWWEINKKMGDAWPHWGELHQNECASCHKKFETRLRLLKSCSNCAAPV